MDLTFPNFHQQLQSSFFKLPLELREECYRALLESINCANCYDGRYTKETVDFFGGCSHGQKYRELFRVTGACKRFHNEILNLGYRDYACYLRDIHYPIPARCLEIISRVRDKIRKLKLTIEITGVKEDNDKFKERVVEVAELFEGGSCLMEITITVLEVVCPVLVPVTDGAVSIHVPGQDPQGVLEAVSRAFRVHGEVILVVNTRLGYHVFSEEQLNTVKDVIKGTTCTTQLVQE